MTKSVSLAVNSSAVTFWGFLAFDMLMEGCVSCRTAGMYGLNLSFEAKEAFWIRDSRFYIF